MIDAVLKWATSPQPLILAAALYALIAVGYAAQKRPGMVLAFLAYAVANVGFLIDWGAKK